MSIRIAFALLLLSSALAGAAAPAPAYASDFPDPYVLAVPGGYRAYGTNVAGANVPMLAATQLGAWQRAGDALPTLPSWAVANKSLTWAPCVLERQGRFLLYFTARHRACGRQAVGVAVADRPEGPFVHPGDRPLICQEHLGGSIDPATWVEDGRAYLLWKNDGNANGSTVGLWIHELTEDGLGVTGEPAELIRKDQEWEEPLIEGPSMLKHGGRYYLFYSANWWMSDEYAIGYAVSDSLTGPYQKPLNGPLFGSHGKLKGPGGQEFFTGPEGETLMVFHGWTSPHVGYPQGARALHLMRVGFENGVPAFTPIDRRPDR